MRTIKLVLEKNKGLFSLLLVFIVLYTGSVRGLLLAELDQNQLTSQKNSPNNFSECDIHSSRTVAFTAVNQAKTTESEIDEVHLDFTFPKPNVFTLVFEERQFFFQFLTKIIVDKLRLYDLYCNWKIHRS
ncbi:hypothetical protein [Flavobacterium lacus]|uniref:Uncharacterized protein n=1 Tax=Flavobacterium lacus TaxID=1353778 RepID=A0A328WP14_9FLAO|nr:hypothetical protein [Flavobacterium lacus]RAR47863.1 hypothetical protein B0I10_107142 [Flavobacterium lacus]